MKNCMYFMQLGKESFLLPEGICFFIVQLCFSKYNLLSALAFPCEVHEEQVRELVCLVEVPQTGKFKPCVSLCFWAPKPALR